MSKADEIRALRESQAARRARRETAAKSKPKQPSKIIAGLKEAVAHARGKGSARVTQMFNARLPVELLERLDVFAKQNELGRSEAVRIILEERLG